MTEEVIPPAPVETQKNHRFARFLIFSAISIAIIGTGVYLGYKRINDTITTHLADLHQQSATHQSQLEELQKSIAAMQQANQQSVAMAAKQQQLITEWEATQKGDLEKWYVAEADYLVKLANDQVQFAHNTSLAIVLLQRADQILSNLQDTRLLEIRKSIATNLAAMQVNQPVDVTKVYVQLAALNNLIDTLPLPINPLPANSQTATTSDDPAATWWQKGLNHTWQALNKIIIVRNTSQNSLPLVLPEEKIFLYQNLHAQLEGAMWGALHHNQSVYQISLQRAAVWIQKYFASDSPVVKSTLQQLQQLQTLNLDTATPNIAVTIQLFDSYLGQNKTLTP